MLRGLPLRPGCGLLLSFRSVESHVMSVSDVYFADRLLRSWSPESRRCKPEHTTQRELCRDFLCHLVDPLVVLPGNEA
ncbi:hypothetical protein C8R47DRAFT_1113963 [Mycena vitilis]|nr:hypothetical protein C8R47DRAFT_1113963 [Mycena vitilis]